MKNNILEISPKVTIGEGTLELYLDVTIDGKGYISKRADSLLPNFLRIIYSYMANKVFPTGMYYFTATSAGDFYDSDDWKAITGVTAGGTTTITFSGSTWTVGDYVQIFGTSGITPDINGWHEIIASSPGSVTINVSTSGSFVDQGARIRRWRHFDDSPERASFDTFDKAFILVGRNGDTNVVDQQALNNEWDKDEGPGEPFEINYSDTIISTPGLDYNNKRGELVFSVVVTNNSGASMDIGELGLFAAAVEETFDNRTVIIARDNITPATLGDGQTATFNYRIRTNMAADGGFTENFIKLLATQFSQTIDQTIDDVFASTFLSTEETGKFMSIGPSGSGRVSTILSGVEGQYVGVQIGTGSTTPEFDDHNLETRVTHGEGSGQMIYHGTIVDNFAIVGSKASFDLTAIFENVSGGSIGVNEVGLYTANDVTNGALNNIAMLTRHVLGSTVTVNDSQFLKVSYTIELTVA